MKGVILVVVMNRQLQRERKKQIRYYCYCLSYRRQTVLRLLKHSSCGDHSGLESGVYFYLFSECCCMWSRSHQPSLQCDGVDVKVSNQAKVMVHMFQTAQHLKNKGKHWDACAVTEEDTAQDDQMRLVSLLFCLF